MPTTGGPTLHLKVLRNRDDGFRKRSVAWRTFQIQPQDRRSVRPDPSTLAARPRRRGDRVNRREFITLLGGAAVWPFAARAQQGERVRRIGVLMPYAENDRDTSPRVTALRQGLQQFGWTEGRNVRLDHRWSASDADSTRKFARELVDLGPDVILTDTTPVTAAVLRETRTVPVVFVNVGDPIGSRFVASFPR